MMREREKESNATICGPPLAHQGIETSIAKRPSFVIFQGGGGLRTPVPLSGSAHVCRLRSTKHACNLDIKHLGAGHIFLVLTMLG